MSVHSITCCWVKEALTHPMIASNNAVKSSAQVRHIDLPFRYILAHSLLCGTRTHSDTHCNFIEILIKYFCRVTLILLLYCLSCLTVIISAAHPFHFFINGKLQPLLLSPFVTGYTHLNTLLRSLSVLSSTNSPIPPDLSAS